MTCGFCVPPWYHCCVGVLSVLDQGGPASLICARSIGVAPAVIAPATVVQEQTVALGPPPSTLNRTCAGPTRAGAVHSGAVHGGSGFEPQLPAMVCCIGCRLNGGLHCHHSRGRLVGGALAVQLALVDCSLKLLVFLARCARQQPVPRGCIRCALARARFDRTLELPLLLLPVLVLQTQLLCPLKHCLLIRLLAAHSASECPYCSCSPAAAAALQAGVTKAKKSKDSAAPR